MLKVIQRHAGRYERTGGEYRSGYRVEEDGRKVHFSSASGDFDFCSACGQFHRESEWHRSTDDPYEYLSDEEIAELQEQADDYGRVNLTGHERVGCQYEGGCIICHPCNHTKCNKKKQRLHDRDDSVSVSVSTTDETELTEKQREAKELFSDLLS